MASAKDVALTDLKELFPEVELRILRAALFIHGSDIQKASEYLLDEVCPGNARRNVRSEAGSTGNASLGTAAAPEETDASGTLTAESGPRPSPAHSLQPETEAETTDIPASTPTDSLSLSVGESGEASAAASSVHAEVVVGGDSGFLSALIGSGSICQSLGSVCEAVNEKEFDAALQQADSVEGLQQQFAAARALEAAVRAAEEAAGMAETESGRGGEEVEEKVREIIEAVAKAKEESQKMSAKNLAEKGVIWEEMAVLQRDLQQVVDNKTLCENSLQEIHLSLQKRVRAANERTVSARAHKVSLEGAAQERLREQQQSLEVAMAELRALTDEETECKELQKFVTSRVQAVDKLQGEVDVISEDVEMLKLRLAAHHSPTASTSTSIVAEQPAVLIASVRDRLLELHSVSHLSTHTPPSPASLSPRSARGADALFSRSESLRSEGRPYMPPLQTGRRVEEGEEDWVNVEESGGRSSTATPATSTSSHSSSHSD